MKQNEKKIQNDKCKYEVMRDVAKKINCKKYLLNPLKIIGDNTCELIIPMVQF